MNREQGIQEIERTRIMAIVRGVKEEHILSVAEALFKGGVTVMEVTLNTVGALPMIHKLQQQWGDRMFIGAGTVLDLDDAKQAVLAGASFLVTPNLDEEVIRWSSQEGVPIFPGAMTPTEVVKAWKAGATAVKIFPSASLGLPYIKELMGPLDKIPMMAVGGVTEGNIKQFIEIGCYGLGIGGSLINLKEIEAGNFGWITDKAVQLLAASRN
ncbi:2-dehydro-3-deoxyphosphogluconate aldolase [Paenibacillus pectinilyticus]|uniref:2-dehydro-3-deoxyphosphogluconate aldolase n=1 Tax=Paenibacillus pectinilyticus TaxID=512399 RepID=A0A1C0ZUY2_9BACL|nr:bifunctional 4-hydroxy-2-oxoglutarate aldolase/2-dehydro-3-deoxy-phosphogluconate aldolase [Paenibacillus pectinilyticus]OCT11910.1 2-dehydro-3-deoxyphosphogluconate aldolase [Paenibacillus pectinilyticus]